MQVAIFTGEASGDRTGAQLVQEIRRLRPDWTFWGTGGKYLRQAGVEVLIDASRWGVVGIAQGLSILPRAVNALARVEKEMVRRRPDLIIPVDSGAFNIGFGPIKGVTVRARRSLPDAPIFYYFPPGSWRKTLKYTGLGGLSDAVATPFPWSETELRRFGVNATFVGHPLLDLVRPSQPVSECARKWGIDPEHPVVGILPGSRVQEIQHVLPAQLGAAEIIRRRVPGVQFVLGLAPTVDRTLVEKILAHCEKEEAARRAAEQQSPPSFRAPGQDDSNGTIPKAVPVSPEGGLLPPDELARRQKEWIRRTAEMPPPPSGPLPLTIVEDAAYEMMAASDVLLVTSGTATLEAAILGKPMVISYRMSILNGPQYLLVHKSLPKFIGMPNLIAERQIVPEFLQDAATPEAMATPIIDYLLEPDRMLRTREELRQVVRVLGEPGGAARAAQLAVELAESRRRERSASA